MRKQREATHIAKVALQRILAAGRTTQKFSPFAEESGFLGSAERRQLRVRYRLNVRCGSLPGGLSSFYTGCCGRRGLTVLLQPPLSLSKGVGFLALVKDVRPSRR